MASLAVPALQRRPIASSALLFSSRRLAALDDFGVPYQLADGDTPTDSRLGWLGSPHGGPRLMWPAKADRRPPRPAEAPRLSAGSLHLRSGAEIPVFARLIGDHQARSLLAESGGAWEPTESVFDLDGDPIASIWIRHEDGSVFLPFDPDEVRLNYLSEHYHETAPGSASNLRGRAMRGYYRARGVMPRKLQIWLRRRYARLQARTPFPRWPVETGFHDFKAFLLESVQALVAEPLPTIAPWPRSKSWALVLTHDVETVVGLEAMDRVLDLERSLGLRSSWNFIPARRYDVGLERIGALLAEGFEVGVHGLYHDGRDLESRATLEKRLPRMREAAERWSATGFRSPATHRSWGLMPLLGFDYDSSYPDTDPFEPQGGGCCTWLPFFNQNMVELPLTMPQDHTLFVILGHRDERVWTEKVEFLRSHGGMATLDTHPDYLVDERLFGAYKNLLEAYLHSDGVWNALPAEVSAWWRRRAASTLERRGTEWIVTGPAAGEARVELWDGAACRKAAWLTGDSLSASKSAGNSASVAV